MKRNEDHDPLLAIMVSIANYQAEPTEPLRSGTTVTLLVGGITISGHIIPAWQWMETVGAISSGSSGDKSANVFQPLVDAEHHWRDYVRTIEAKDEATLMPTEHDALRLKCSPSYVNLAEARTITARGPVPTTGTCMRIRLDRVDGWFLGTLGEGQLGA